MKKVLSLFYICVGILLLSACAGVKKVAYFKNIDEVSLAASNGLYDAHIMPKDLILVTVNTTDPQVSAPFNNGTGGSRGGQAAGTTTTTDGYLVDNQGNINFPVVGKLHVAGLTKNQCEDMIKNKIAPYLAANENPVVTVRMASYRVTITGEVKSPGVIPVSTEKISIIEALAQAGDLTIYGKRDNIILIREKADGEKEYHRLNLNDANIINSPYYYLQQNDIIYVQPNTVQSQNSMIGNSTSLWFSFVGIVVSLASFMVTVLR